MWHFMPFAISEFTIFSPHPLASFYLSGMHLLDFHFHVFCLQVRVGTQNSPCNVSVVRAVLYVQHKDLFVSLKRLDEVIDRINRMHGSETIVLGSQQYTPKDGKGKADVFANAIKHDHRSPNPTTRWSDVIKLT